MDRDIDYQSDMLANKTRHYLITGLGRVIDEASMAEVYSALSHALREEIMINWLASARTFKRHDVRMLYYLSLEYLPGRIFSNHITNLGATDIVKAVSQKLNRSFTDLIDCEPDPGLGNGGLGRLASCFTDSLATLHYPAQAYGLRYQYGIFEQQIWDGLQIEAPDCWLMHENPWEFRRDDKKLTVNYGGTISTEKNLHGDEIYQLHDSEDVWALPFDIPIIGYGIQNKFSVCTLRLWSTKESPRNFQLQRYNAGLLGQAAENTTLTDVLYPNDNHETGKRIRLKQEYLLVSSSLQDIIHHYLQHHDNFRSFADKVRIQINDTHPALVIAELTHLLTSKYDIPWNTAVEITRECTSYTNHTILSEALEEWDCTLMQKLLPRQQKTIERLNLEFCNTMRSQYNADEEKIQRMSIIHDGKVRMANLAIVGSHKVNGVAELHTRILKERVFKDFAETFPDKFVNITNGVTQRRWLLHCNPELSKFITKRIGDGWITDFTQIRQLEQYAGDHDSLEELMNIKRANKSQLIDYIKHHNKPKDSNGKVIGPAPVIDIDSLFDVQVKRIHEYKRQLMNILHLIMLYFEMLDDPNHKRIKRTAIFSGKAAGGYETAKDTIRLIECVGRRINQDPDIKGMLRVIFVDNYSVSRAKVIIPAADLSEQTSTAGFEASGTGNMKLTINGALTIGTDDGANIEMKEEVGEQWWPFTFGASAEEVATLQRENSYNPKKIYEENPKIKRALDSLIDGSFAEFKSEHEAFSDLYHKLLEVHYGGPPDRYFTLLDLEAFYEAQKRVEEMYDNPHQWAEYVIHNIAGMGKFSTDNSIQNYSEKIWNLTPCPADNDLLEQIRDEYTSHDQCRLY